MLIKAGVDISRLNREIRRALPLTQDVLDEFSIELVVTSTYEGNHGEGSLHYSDDAYDFERPKVHALAIRDNVKMKLGYNYDVVLEGDHIHIEYDPK